MPSQPAWFHRLREIPCATVRRRQRLPRAGTRSRSSLGCASAARWSIRPAKVLGPAVGHDGSISKTVSMPANTKIFLAFAARISLIFVPDPSLSPGHLTCGFLDNKNPTETRSPLWLSSGFIPRR